MTFRQLSYLPYHKRRDASAPLQALWFACKWLFLYNFYLKWSGRPTRSAASNSDCTKNFVKVSLKILSNSVCHSAWGRLSFNLFLTILNNSINPSQATNVSNENTPRTRPGIDLSLLQNLTMLTTCNVKRMYVCRSVFKRDWASRTFYVSIVVLDSEKFANFPDRFIHHARNQLIAKKVCTWIIRRFSIYSWNNRDRVKEGAYLIYWRGGRPIISVPLITACRV